MNAAWPKQAISAACCCGLAAPIHSRAWRPVLALQLGGRVIVITSLLALGRSFGFVAADRALKTSGPYAGVRHPV